MLYAPKDFKRWGSSAEAEPEGAVTVCESGGAACWQPAARTTSKSGHSRANFLRMIDPPNSEIVTWGHCRLAQIDSVARFQRSMVSASKSSGDLLIPAAPLQPLDHILIHPRQSAPWSILCRNFRSSNSSRACWMEFSGSADSETLSAAAGLAPCRIIAVCWYGTRRR